MTAIARQGTFVVMKADSGLVSYGYNWAWSAPAKAAVNFSPQLGPLSRRQRDVLALIVQGQSNKEIARSLNLAEGTVKIHVAALFAKLGIHRRAAAALAAVQIFGKAA